MPQVRGEMLKVFLLFQCCDDPPISVELHPGTFLALSLIGTV